MNIIFNEIKLFAKGFSVENFNQFIQELNSNGQDLLIKTPQDLIALIKYWNIHSEISSRKKMLEFSIENDLKEIDDNRKTKTTID